MNWHIVRSLEGTAPSSNHSVALMIKQQGGKWQIAEDKKDSVHPFVCELPACKGVTPASSTLDQSSNTTGLRYGVASNSWVLSHISFALFG